MDEKLVVKGAREHNLRNVGIAIPRDQMVVFTGLSGSGKSSLAFDTIFAEGQRRYVESLSSYARQFLGRLDKPDVDFIAGLSPAVSIDQKSTSRNPRSTVGTITEVYDYLRLLYARAGQAYCPECGEKIQAQTAQQIVDRLLTLPEKTRFQILAPVVRGRKGEYSELFADLVSQGFSAAVVDGETVRLTQPPKLERKIKHDIFVRVDRLVMKEGVRTRLSDSIETALKLADGLVVVDFVDRDVSDPQRSRRFSENRACPNDHPLQLEEIEPRTFSFNAPYGACPDCSGLGSHLEVDPELVVPNPELSIAEGAIRPWSTKNKYLMHMVAGLGEELGFDLDTPFRELSAAEKKALLRGRDYRVKVKFRNRWGRMRTYSSGFEGAIPWIMRKREETESEVMRARYEGYMRQVPCSTCHGARLKPEVLAVKIGKLNIAELTKLSIAASGKYLAEVELTGPAKKIAEPILKEVQVRLQFLQDVGLGYLTLARGAATLSGGEAQRIRLATQIGSGLVGVLYVLDEPSIGLHQRDNHKLIETLKKLRDLGNTLLVVEHDEDTIRASDWIVDIGPEAGEHGGEVLYSGPVPGIADCKRSLTGQYLSGKKQIAIPEKRRQIEKERQLKIIGARENNLKNIDVSIPLGKLVLVTGVSGSGKSTLINQVMYQALAAKLQRKRVVPGRHKEIAGIEHLDKVVHVDQSPIGRNPRSNPATYTGVWDAVRALFAQTPEAQLRGYGPGRFSFNVKGGRCESCKGDGTLKIEMNFLPDVYVPCEVCGGARYNQETLEIKYRGKSVAEVLDMPISEAAEFFAPINKISRHLNTLVEVGLGYLRLGQSATTLSGGEAQRVKLASELQRRSNGRTIYVLDEPTTGLHLEDIRKLMLVLQSLVDKGNSVIVIEHNLDVIKCADWVIDLGPEGGDGGGRLVAQGTPEQVAKVKASYTGQYLRAMLK
ncbi:excinuclease ABC subunit UvrA [Varibaculum cambriense]|uniref:excinuclease ABC subunit UvrA n=1 Tax=Varibaculum cambriense TaxID=184870 RepID=UPI002806231D|nr:excinuclease ABC subunit UvrA [Varibaculum cambriense]MDU5615278.1 excinuclease ABC subunit UvrA [Varibaculum cambriense]MDU6681066.1 excinuclease ABC subunit UvrA [Varibaculum cambriense]